jgi:hypothetical protein
MTSPKGTRTALGKEGRKRRTGGGTELEDADTKM